MSATVADPDGVTWTVRRRWYPWRRALSLRDLLASKPGTAQPTQETAESDDAQESELPRNVLLKVLFVVVAAIVWVGYGIGKLLFYTVVVALFVVGSILELLLALIVMPITLLLRMIGLARWPVEIGRDGEHFGTRHERDFAAAGEVRDGLIAEIGRGVLPTDRREKPV